MSRQFFATTLAAVLSCPWTIRILGLVILSSHISCGSDARFQGALIKYDWFEVEEKSGAICVNFGVDDLAREDGFVRENLTGLVLDPEGQFHGFNTKFGCTFVRAEKAA